MTRNMLLTTVATMALGGTPALAQNVDIQDVTPTENGVVIEADAGIGRVDAETPSPAAQSETTLTRTQEPEMAPVTEQLNADFSAEKGTGVDEGPTGSTQFDNVRVSELLGAEVKSDDGEVVGEVDRIVKIDTEIAAIVGIGGFLGFGEREVALSLQDLDYTDGTLTLTSMNKGALGELPEYTAEGSAEMPENAAVIVYD